MIVLVSQPVECRMINSTQLRVGQFEFYMNKKKKIRWNKYFFKKGGFTLITSAAIIFASWASVHSAPYPYFVWHRTNKQLWSSNIKASRYISRLIIFPFFFRFARIFFFRPSSTLVRPPTTPPLHHVLSTLFYLIFCEVSVLWIFNNK